MLLLAWPVTSALRKAISGPRISHLEWPPAPATAVSFP